ncbi:hypothetical protein WN944_003780 [Citrus x changshan-huyou]|uniref:Uncharacterized protein n=1 Tax=Citrus x changshan-huyou TaxID=2935761 RepID=A0AAP0LZ89_9ROSI
MCPVSTYGSLANRISLARKPGESFLLWKEIEERCDVLTQNPIRRTSETKLRAIGYWLTYGCLQESMPHRPSMTEGKRERKQLRLPSFAWVCPTNH